MKVNIFNHVLFSRNGRTYNDRSGWIFGRSYKWIAKTLDATAGARLKLTRIWWLQLTLLIPTPLYTLTVWPGYWLCHGNVFICVKDLLPNTNLHQRGWQETWIIEMNGLSPSVTPHIHSVGGGVINVNTCLISAPPSSVSLISEWGSVLVNAV